MKFFTLAVMAAALVGEANAACEVDCEPVAGCRSAELDITIGLDNSGSMGFTDGECNGAKCQRWDAALIFIQSLKANIDQQFKGVRWGMNVWSTSSKILQGIAGKPRGTAQRSNFDTLLNEIIAGAHAKPSGGTYIEYGIDECAKQYSTTNYIRKDSIKSMCILISDGAYSDTKSVVVNKANSFKDKNVLLSVGIGPDFTSGGCPDACKNLEALVSEPVALHAFTAAGFKGDAIRELLAKIVSSICFATDSFAKNIEDSAIACYEGDSTDTNLQILKVRGVGMVSTGTGLQMACKFARGVAGSCVETAVSVQGDTTCIYTPGTTDPTAEAGKGFQCIAPTITSADYGGTYTVESMRNYDAGKTGCSFNDAGGVNYGGAGCGSNPTVNRNRILLKPQGGCSELPKLPAFPTGDPANGAGSTNGGWAPEIPPLPPTLNPNEGAGLVDADAGNAEGGGGSDLSGAATASGAFKVVAGAFAALCLAGAL